MQEEPPKFVNWVDDAVRRNPNLAKALDDLPERKLLNDVNSGKRNLDEFADGRKRKYGDYTAYSNYGEIKARLFFEDNTFRIGKNEGTLKYISLDKVTDLDAPIRKGIDAVYEFSTPPLPCWCERHAYIYFNFYLFAKTSLFLH